MAYNNVKVKERQTVSQSSQTKPLGIVSEVPMNEWNAAVSYEKLNLVTYKNATFIAKRANVNIPPLDTANWEETWMLLKSGIGISSVVVEYAKGDVTSSNPPQSEWSTDLPSPEVRKLLWTRVTITYTDGTSTVYYSVGVSSAPTKTSDLINDGDGTSPFATVIQLDEEAQRAMAAEQANDKKIAAETARAESAESGIDTRVKSIESKIPTDASADNPLETKNFINSSINALAAFFITPTATGDKAWASRAALLGAKTFYSGGIVRVPTQNDYAIVLADESQEKGVDGTYPTTRYSYQGGTYPNGLWSFQYIVNNTSLTQAQVDALNSGINAASVAQINTNKNDIAALKSLGTVRYDIVQSLTAAQQQQARANLGAGTPYILPVASATTLGGVKSSTTGTDGTDYNVQVNADGTMKVNVPKPDLSRYMTTDTEQSVDAKKTFGKGIDVFGGGVGVDDDADAGAVYRANGILVSEGGIPDDRVSGDESSHFLYFPWKTGTLMVEVLVEKSGEGNAVTDVTVDPEDKSQIHVTLGKTFVTLDTLQRITGDKTFTGTVKSQGNGFEVFTTGLNQVGTQRAIYKNYGIEYYFKANLAGAQENQYDLSFPKKSGTLALTTDITWANLPDKPTIPTIPNLSRNVSGSGNAVTDITVSGHTITITKGETFAKNADLTALTGRVATIEGKIPTQASATDQLAPKSFVNSTVQTATANFRGNWETWASVPSAVDSYPVDYAGSKTPTVNDYLVVQDASGFSGKTLTGTWRFKYSGTWGTNGKNGWQPEYQVNETPLTAAQLAALNSGITSTGVGQITTNKNDIASIKTKNTEQDTAIKNAQDKANAAMPKAGGTMNAGATLSFNSSSTSENTRISGDGVFVDNGGSSGAKAKYSYSKIVVTPAGLSQSSINLLFPFVGGTLVVDSTLNSTLSDYATLDTQQTITAKKIFNAGIEVGNATSGNSTANYGSDGIYLFSYSGTSVRQIGKLTFPQKTGTIATTADIKTYTASTGISISSSNAISTTAASSTASGHVSTGAQTFAGRKTFNGGINIPSGATIQLSGSSGSEGQVLTSHGSSKAPTWETPSGGSGGTNVGVSYNSVFVDGGTEFGLDLPAREAKGTKYVCFLTIRTTWFVGSIDVYKDKPMYFRLGSSGNTITGIGEANITWFEDKTQKSNVNYYEMASKNIVIFENIGSSTCRVIFNGEQIGTVSGVSSVYVGFEHYTSSESARVSWTMLKLG